MRATRVGADTALAQIARLVDGGADGKAPVQRLADRDLGVFVPVVIALAVATLGFWLGAGRARDLRVHRRRRGADHRLPVRARPGDADGAAGRHRPRRPARHPDQGPGGARVDPPRRHDRARQDRHGDDRADERSSTSSPRDGTDADEALRLAGALEDASEHPIARAIAAAARDELGALPPVEAFANREGLGVEGVVDGHAVLVGRPALLAEWGMRAARRARRCARREAEARGRTAVVVGWDGAARAVLVVADTVKPTSAEAVAALARSACARCC